MPMLFTKPAAGSACRSGPPNSAAFYGQTIFHEGQAVEYLRDAGRQHVADRRGWCAGGGGAHGDPHDLEFPRTRHRRGRQGRAAGPLRRLFAFPAPPSRGASPLNIGGIAEHHRDPRRLRRRSPDVVASDTMAPAEHDYRHQVAHKMTSGVQALRSRWAHREGLEDPSPHAGGDA